MQLVNNAGIFLSGQVDELTADQHSRVWRPHLGVAQHRRTAWPIMRKRGYGRIVNTTSCSLFGVAGSSP